jgi:hypothetical protein
MAVERPKGTPPSTGSRAPAAAATPAAAPTPASVALTVLGRRVPLFYDFAMSWRRAAVDKLAQAVDYVYQAAVDGDVAEFGTFSGLTAAALARSMREVERFGSDWIRAHGLGEKKLHLFDSFEGFPSVSARADVESPSVASGVWAAGAGKGRSEAELLEICGAYLDRSRVRTHPGWFEDSLARLEPDTRFALVHLDCDLYESTRDVLVDLFERDRWSDGCTLLFDDWNCNRASPRFGERRAWAECVERYRPSFTDCGAYGPLGWQLILHR